MGDVTRRHCVCRGTKVARGIRHWSLGALAFALLVVLVPSSLADHHQEAAEAPQMSAEEQAMMAAWEEAGTPGDEHEWLASHAGEYDLTITSWMAPDGDPMVMQGTAVIEATMGDRVIRETVDSDFMGQPFKGLGMNGYDNVTDKHWGTWMDSMSTGMGTSWGTRDGNTLTMKTKFPDPMSGEMKVTRMEMTWEDDGNGVMRAYDKHDGEEFMSMEITYTPK